MPQQIFVTVMNGYTLHPSSLITRRLEQFFSIRTILVSNNGYALCWVPVMYGSILFSSIEPGVFIKII